MGDPTRPATGRATSSDESWEFYEPDPEIQEILQESSKHKGAPMRYGEEGFKYGKWFKGRGQKLSPETLKAAALMYAAGLSLKTMSSRLGVCRTTVWLWINRSGIRANRNAKRLKEVHCLYCNNLFLPKRACRRFCSHSCAIQEMWKTRPRKKPRPDKLPPRKANFIRLWNLKKPIWVIEKSLGMSNVTVSRWRKELGLPSRRKCRAAS